jgi:hypothetical protein
MDCTWGNALTEVSARSDHHASPPVILVDSLGSFSLRDHRTRDLSNIFGTKA